jgi:anti-sigma regulatory factor (Ser/Thr protein kinase)
MTGIDHPAGLRHAAFVFDDEDEFVGRTAAHLLEGMEEEEALIAVLTRSNRAAMRDALGGDAQEVLFLDCDAQYLRPARTLASYDAVVRRTAEERRSTVRVVAEMPPSQTAIEASEWLAYEAIFNLALAHLPASVLCLYDERAVSESVIDMVWKTHPWSFSDGRAANPLYQRPEHVTSLLAPARGPVSGLEPVPIGGDVGAFRERVASAMIARGLPQACVVNMLVAASEIMDNAKEHAGGASEARVGMVAGRFVCEISDQGPGLADPMAGYYPPLSGRSPGDGLWVARQLVHLLEIIPSAPGTTVRLWL